MRVGVLSPTSGHLGIGGSGRKQSPPLSSGSWACLRGQAGPGGTNYNSQSAARGLEAVARAGQAGPGGIGRAGAALRRWFCCSPAAAVEALEAVLPPGAASLGCWRRAGEERRWRAGPGRGRGWLGHAGLRAGEALLRFGSARPGAANAPRALHSAPAAGPHLDWAPRSGANAGRQCCSEHLSWECCCSPSWC